MSYTEADTRANLIDPLLRECGWRAKDIVREYYFTDGRKLISGKRGKRYFIDYLLHYNNTNFNIETRSERAFAVHYRKYIERYHNDKVKAFLLHSGALRKRWGQRDGQRQALFAHQTQWHRQKRTQRGI